MLGDEFALGVTIPAERCERDMAWFKPWLNGEGLLSHLFEKKLLRSNRIRHLDGGLEKIGEGLELLKSGKISGEKLAYTLVA